MKQILFILLSFSLLFYSCVDKVESTIGEINGVVRDAETNAPIAACSVVLVPTGRTVGTGTDGTFHFEDVEPGQYTLQFIKEGYRDDNKSIVVNAANKTNVDMLMLKGTGKSLEVKPSSLSLTDEGEAKALMIYATKEWSISGADEWLKVSQPTGTGDTNITVTATANTTQEDRSKNLTITSGVEKLVVTVSQRSQKALTVGKAKYEVDNAGGIITAEIKHSIDFQIEIPFKFATWIKQVTTRAISVSEVNLSISPNTENSTREGYVLIKGENELRDTIRVFQSEADMILLQGNIKYVPITGGRIDIELRTNIDYDILVPTGITWLHQIASTRAIRVDKVAFNVDASNGEERTAKIIFKDKNSALESTLTVVQTTNDVLIINVKNKGDLANALSLATLYKVRKLIITGSLPITSDLGILRDAHQLEELDLRGTDISSIGSMGISKSLKRIFLPSSIKQIYDFSNYSLLEEVHFGEDSQLKRIGDDAFYNCKSLKFIDLPNSLTDISKAFRNCSSLSSIQLPDGITEISETFSGCTSLTTINIPNSVTSIAGAFSGCTSLTTINIPNSVTNIMGAFSGCTSLTTVNIPSSITNMDNAFSGCTQLNINIKIPYGIKSLNGTFSGCSSLNLAGITIPASVTSIDNTFSGTTIESITIPEGVASMKSTFANCTNLKSINMPQAIRSLEWTFFDCVNLKNIILPNSLKEIGEGAFQGSGLTSITIPEGVTTIELQAFCECKELKATTLPNSLKEIKNCCYRGAFEGSGLTSITIPEGVTKIAGDTFKECKDLKSITLPNSLKEIESGIFQSSGLTSITIPEGVTKIGNGTFYGCKNLKSITLPNSLKEIGAVAFYESGLTSITIPEGITKIEDRVFYKCPLTFISLPSSLKEISSENFNGTDYFITICECHAEMPPEIIENNSLYGETLRVPTQSIEAYKLTEWKSRFNTIEAL